MTELEKALNGEKYDSKDKEVLAYSAKVKKLCYTYNSLSPDDTERSRIIGQLVDGNSDYIFIESGFQCAFGKNIHFKGMAILNFNCILLDSASITIGNRTLIGPGSIITCTNHSLDPKERIAGVFNNKPITIGDDVWLGANVTVCPGVTIGDSAVIGAGAVVTKDIPANVVAVGNPCRVLREVTEADKLETSI